VFDARCFNLIACSPGDSKAVSTFVNPVLGLIGAEAALATWVASGCGGNGGVFNEASFEFKRSNILWFSSILGNFVFDESID
jgi:hypothetical protein